MFFYFKKKLILTAAIFAIFINAISTNIDLEAAAVKAKPVPNKKKSGWETTDFVWNLGIASQSDAGIDLDPFYFFAHYFSNIPPSLQTFENIKDGDVVWLRACFVPHFYRNILPYMTKHFVLIISDGDESFPSRFAREIDVESFVNDENIIHIFAQNCDYKGPSTKVSHLPIGIDFHTIAYRGGYWGEKGSPKEQEACLKNTIAALYPTAQRKLGAFVDFQHNDSMRNGTQCRYLEFGEDRTSIFQQLLKTNLIYFDGPMRRADLWLRKGEYAFSISPHGNGLDCHRTWEDLALGCIVIVRTSPLDPLYDGLPVVIVNHWSEVTKENMEKWLVQYGDASSNPFYSERLTSKYWLNLIREKSKPYQNLGMRR